MEAIEFPIGAHYDRDLQTLSSPVECVQVSRQGVLRDHISGTSVGDKIWRSTLLSPRFKRGALTV
jgi:hypothetical protein